MSEADQKNKALNIAKNVHEIKKNYFKVIEGIDDIIIKETPFDQLTLSDLCKMLYLSTLRTLQKEQRNINLSFHVHSNTLIHEHSMLMSVLRNLINNAIEAIEFSGEIKLVHREDETHHFFIISDSGCGMTEEMTSFIFKPGFSTKYDDVTGSSNRGIGLTLVKDIVEQYFKGEIGVNSKLNQGTVFELKIPKNLSLQEDQ